MTLEGFTHHANCAAGRALAEHFEGPQLALLSEVLDRFEAVAHSNALTQPLGLLYLASRAWGELPAEQAEHVGAATVLYLCSLDTFDDIQDDDLGGKALGAVDTATAINCALSFSFLAFRSAHAAAMFDPRPERRAGYLAAFDRASISAVKGQHGDLTSAASSPEDVLALHAAKTSSVALLLELGGLISSCDEASLECYRRAGPPLAAGLQVVDDLRDIFGKDESPDLRDRRMTYPLACFLELASDAQRTRFDELRKGLPASLPEIRNLFYDTGVVERCADTIDDLRVAFHREIAATSNCSAPHRLLLSVVDALAESIYEPEPVAETASWFAPSDPFSLEVAAAQQTFVRSLGNYRQFEGPSLSPWHLPHFEYDPGRRTIFYPDVDGMPEEVLPFHAKLCGTSDPASARQTLVQQLPFVVAHEMFHFLRHERALLSEDRWHEEHVANRLAVAYAQSFCPVVLERVLETARALCERPCDSNAVARILGRCQATSGSVTSYDVDVMTAAVVHARMLTDLASLPLHLESEIANLLGLRGSDLAAAE